MVNSKELTNETSNESNLRKLANAAGFLFQLRIKHEVESKYRIHHKTVLATEHRWLDPETGYEGFIDLIITAGTNGKMVVECKRVKDAEWLFLVPKSASSVESVHILWTMMLDDDRQIAAWDKFILDPDSIESMFCVVRGRGEGDRPMLERLASTLLRSVESLADEELNYQRHPGRRGLRFYFPVIVTTAKLYLCRYESTGIDISTGLLESGEFEEVPFIRFTKSLSTRISTSRQPSNLPESAAEGLRTVFVVNSSNFTSFLQRRWEFRGDFNDDNWPWDLPIWKNQENVTL